MTAILKTTLEAIRNAANSYLDNVVRRAEDWIVLSGPTDLDGAPYPALVNRIAMTVFNITAATALRNQPPAPDRNMPYAATPDLYLDIHLMFAANFAPGNYAEGLDALSRLIGFFQLHPVFTAENTPTLDPGIDKVALEIENLTLADLHHLTAMLGTRYQPSVFYKLRLLPIRAIGEHPNNPLSVPERP